MQAEGPKSGCLDGHTQGLVKLIGAYAAFTRTKGVPAEWRMSLDSRKTFDAKKEEFVEILSRTLVGRSVGRADFDNKWLAINNCLGNYVLLLDLDTEWLTGWMAERPSDRVSDWSSNKVNGTSVKWA